MWLMARVKLLYRLLEETLQVSKVEADQVMIL